ncbi:MAG: ABC transporter permease [Bdellovibrionales bacterium]|jgi:lipoprotein-releasing system permease protein|nr:ABC transporter permease [Bdellovibrionales bacterium]
MRLLLSMALRHLLARKRQSIVSLLGIVLGVGFFLSISSLMQGSERDFIRRLIDNAPHITVSDEYRNPHPQPVFAAYPDAAVELRGSRPQTETRGLRGFEKILGMLEKDPGIQASPALAGQALISFAGRDVGVTMNGMIPRDITRVTTIAEHMKEGRIEDLDSNPNGIIIGGELARIMSLRKGRTINLSAPNGQVRAFKIVGIFRTGNAHYDETQVFMTLKRAQALLDRANRANVIIIKLDNAYAAREYAEKLEARIGYKSMSWQEATEDLLSTLMVRNIIMYSVVSAVLIVAAFGIYNVISTVVMEKQRDIAILKSMGFHAGDIKKIFVIQGFLLGIAGNLAGLPLGMGLMLALMQIRIQPPGTLEPLSMPLDWSWPQFAVAGGFAMIASVFAALLPARKAAHVQPVDILRGAA